MPVPSFNFGWVVGRVSNSDNPTSPAEAILNLGRHSENISVVDDTRENVHFDGVWYTQDEKRKFADDLD